MTHEEGTLQEE
jgi:hypothetical protein